MRVAGGGVDGLEAAEARVDRDGQRGFVGERRDAADGEARGGADGVGIGAADFPFATERPPQRLRVAAPVARRPAPSPASLRP